MKKSLQVVSVLILLTLLFSLSVSKAGIKKESDAAGVTGEIVTAKSLPKELLSAIAEDEMRKTATTAPSKKKALKYEYKFSGEKPTLKGGVYDYSYFDDSAFLGNSRILHFETFGYAKNVYGAIGLTVDTVFTKVNEGSEVPIIDELKGHKFRKVYIYFGDNEGGWGDWNMFANHYLRVINAVRERCPKSEIYIISVIPISKSAHEQSNYGYNMNSVNSMNAVLKALAESEKVHYVDCTDFMSNEEGFLPDDAADDGIHMKQPYIEKWVNYLYENT